MCTALVLLTLSVNLAVSASATANAGRMAVPSHDDAGMTQVSLPPAGRPPAPAGRHRLNTVSLRWENDVVGGTDENYTNGTSLTLSRESRGLFGGMWRWFGLETGRLISSYELSQVIMTPHDIKRAVPDPADRPYAGVLFAAVSTQRMDGNRFDGFKLMTGIVGPASGAAEVQKAFHKRTGSPTPQGWDYQLKNEPIVNVVYEHRRRYTVESDAGWGVEAIPLVGGMLGNMLTQAHVNAQLRAGYNLPEDFGTTLMRGLGNLPYPRSRHDRTHRFGVYAFAGGGTNLVLHNLTLDGNTFRDGPRVDKELVFNGAEMGVALWTRRFEATFTYVHWGREFETQARPSRFGAATVGVHF